MSYEPWVAVIVLVAAGVGAAGSDAPLPGKRGDYRGHERHDFAVDGCQTIVVVPKEQAAGKPWVWRAEFFDAFPQIDLALLAKGFHLVYIGVGNTFGCVPSTVEACPAPYSKIGVWQERRKIYRRDNRQDPIFSGTFKLGRTGDVCSWLLPSKTVLL